MIKGKIASGFEYEIEDHKLNNMELLDAIVDMEDNPLGITKVVNLLLGAEQKKALYDHLREQKGNVPIDAVSNAVVEIFTSSQQGKN